MHGTEQKMGGKQKPAGTNPEIRVATSPLLTPGSLSPSDELELVARARNAIEHLVARYERRVFRLARNITRNHEDAEEAVQNAFVKAFENLDAFRGDSSFYTWLVRIVVNEAGYIQQKKQDRRCRFGPDLVCFRSKPQRWTFRRTLDSRG